MRDDRKGRITSAYLGKKGWVYMNSANEMDWLTGEKEKSWNNTSRHIVI